MREEKRKRDRVRGKRERDRVRGRRERERKDRITQHGVTSEGRREKER